MATTEENVKGVFRRVEFKSLTTV